MTTERKQMFEQVFLEAVNILREEAPKDTENLAYNAIKYKWENENEFVIYVDMGKTTQAAMGQKSIKRTTKSKTWRFIDVTLNVFGVQSVFRKLFKNIIKSLKRWTKRKKNKGEHQAKGTSQKKSKGIAPYMPYTNEPWISPRWNGKQNPNEGWWNDAIEFIIQYMAKRLGGELQ